MATRLSLAACLLFAALSPLSVHAQGCTQCLDNTAATPPATQRAYRHAIILMAVTASGLFIAALVIFKRQS
ncbi:MAG: copper resistance protein CopC [Edaphobacter sp.]